MTDLRGGAAKLRQLAKSIRLGAADAVQRAASATLREIVTSTPVDTGLAISNWFVALDRRPFAYRQTPYAPGIKGSTEAANEAAAMQEGERVIGAYRSDVNKRIVIANYLPYIHRLDEGYSPQADPDYVQRAVLRARRRVNELTVESIQKYRGAL